MLEILVILGVRICSYFWCEGCCENFMILIVNIRYKGVKLLRIFYYVFIVVVGWEYIYKFRVGRGGWGLVGVRN